MGKHTFYECKVTKLIKYRQPNTFLRFDQPTKHRVSLACIHNYSQPNTILSKYTVPLSLHPIKLGYVIQASSGNQTDPAAPEWSKLVCTCAPWEHAPNLLDMCTVLVRNYVGVGLLCVRLYLCGVYYNLLYMHEYILE